MNNLTTIEPGNIAKMTKAEAKLALGEVARTLIFDEGYSMKDAAAQMSEEAQLQALFSVAGYVDDEGKVVYSPQLAARWAKKSIDLALTGDKRSLTSMLYAKQLRNHLIVQQYALQAIEEGGVHHITRYVEVSKLIGNMLPGHFVQDGNTVNITNIMLSDDEKKEMRTLRNNALKEVEDFEKKLIEGQLVSKDD